MDSSTYQQLADDLLATARGIADGKRPGYTVASPDVLHNFKSVAAAAGITPMQAWLIYFLKHVSAIQAYAKDPTIPQAEPIKGRFADAINYLQLGFALGEESNAGSRS